MYFKYFIFFEDVAINAIHRCTLGDIFFSVHLAKKF